MELLFENETDYTPDFDLQATALYVAEYILQQEGCPYEAQVGLLLTNEQGIRETNLSCRSIDSVTDVLSFPNIAFETEGQFDFLENEVEEVDFFDPDTGNLVLGDIMICIERVKKQAEEYGHSEKREFSFLVAHSILHLIGYDHMTKKDADIMEQKQDTYLNKLNITRTNK